MQQAIPVTIMRGGTSKGLYFHKADLPNDPTERDKVLLAAMGSPDERQIDGLGGAHPLTSKVAVLSRSKRSDADVDYLFLQVVPDKPEVRDNQNCGNILAGVGPWAIENGLVSVTGDTTSVRIHMVNTGANAVAHVCTHDGHVCYAGEARIDGVPGTASPIPIDFLDIAGSSCGALFPTGKLIDRIEGYDVSCVDNGMPVVCLRASDFGLDGTETPTDLEANADLIALKERIRLIAGQKMNLGDVSDKTVPKMTFLSTAQSGGLVSTQTFIPHRVHEAIGVLGAVSVATVCVAKGTVADELGLDVANTGILNMDIEHPTGFFSVEMEIETNDTDMTVKRSALLRTARKLMMGEVYIPASVKGVP